MKKIVIIDIDSPELLENKVFNPNIASKVSHTYLPLCYLQKEAKKNGIEFITPDVFFKMKDKPSNIFCISYLETIFTKKLEEANVTMLAVICLESPFIATRFYARLKHITKKYKYSFVFSGMKKRVHKNSEYHPVFFPTAFNIDTFESVPFNEKKFATMVSSNKQMDNWKKDLVIKILFGHTVKQVYGERVDAIHYFSDTDCFDLFGRGWESNLNPKFTCVYKGEVDDKHEIVKQYKFVFAYENALFPGYVTEKIFDALFAGSIPVYLGASDITQYVPRNCFINRNDFPDYKSLHSFLEKIDAETYAKYIMHIKEYLQSEMFKRFSQEYFATQMLSILDSEFNTYE